MIEFVLSLPKWIGIGTSMVLAGAVGLVVYFVSYKLVSRYRIDELKDPTGNMFRVVGMLVSLMLSLAFADAIVTMRAVEKTVEREMVAIADTFDDLQWFDLEGTREIRSILVDYTQAVIDDDWPALANDKLGQRTSALKKQLSESVMALESTTPLQEKLWSRILANVDAIFDYRLIRLDNALEKPPVFINVVIFGFLISMAYLGTYRPQPPLVAFVSLYAVFVGLVLHLIVSLSDPFQGGIVIAPTTFEHLVETLQSINR